MSAPQISSDAPLTAAEAEAVATAAVLHHLRAASAAGGGVRPDEIGNWAREALLTSVDKNPHRMTAWGVRSWG